MRWTLTVVALSALGLVILLLSGALDLNVAIVVALLGLVAIGLSYAIWSALHPRHWRDPTRFVRLVINPVMPLLALLGVTLVFRGSVSCRAGMVWEGWDEPRPSSSEAPEASISISSVAAPRLPEPSASTLSSTSRVHHGPCYPARLARQHPSPGFVVTLDCPWMPEFLLSSMQMAPLASHSVVSGRTTVTSESGASYW